MRLLNVYKSILYMNNIMLLYKFEYYTTRIQNNYSLNCKLFLIVHVIFIIKH